MKYRSKKGIDMYKKYIIVMGIFCSLYGQEMSLYDRVKQANRSYTNADIKAKFPELADEIINKARSQASKNRVFMSNWTTADTFREYAEIRDIENKKRHKNKAAAISMPGVSEEEQARKKMRISYLID